MVSCVADLVPGLATRCKLARPAQDDFSRGGSTPEVTTAHASIKSPSNHEHAIK